MKAHKFQLKLEKDSDSNWHYVHIPKSFRDEHKAYEKRGFIAINIAIGQATWHASLMPWADGSAQLSVPEKVRKRENLHAGDELLVTLALDVE